jgi:hypothetical protein
MTHGTGGQEFAVNLPLPPTSSPRGVECRSSTTLGAGNYRLVFTFSNNLTSVGGAIVTGHDPTSGTGMVSGSPIVGPNASLGLTANQCAVNLTNVSNAQYITVTLNSVLDAANNTGDVISPQMGVLVGDVNATGRTDSGDVTVVRNQTVSIPTQQTFRMDVDASGRIDSGDVTVTRNASVTVLPP